VIKHRISERNPVLFQLLQTTHTNGFSDFRAADFLVSTSQTVPEAPKSKPTS